MKKHLVIFRGDAIEKILKGEKTIEVRLSQKSIVPFMAVSRGDEIYMKEAGKKILGKFIVDNVLYFENLDKKQIGEIKRKYNKKAVLDKEFWQSKKNARFATVIFIKKPRRFLSPLKYKKSDLRGWVVLE